MRFPAFTMFAAAIMASGAQAQTASPSAFWTACLANGGAPLTVGDEGNIVAANLYNGKASSTYATAQLFQITAAPVLPGDSYITFERETIPMGEETRFNLRQGQSTFVSATRLKIVALTRGRMEICIIRK